MRFLLEPGDAAAARPCAPGDLRAGDIALLVKWSGGLPSGYVLHRVLCNLSLGGRRLLLTKGDANLLPDWPPSAFQPAGRASALQRGGIRYELPRGLAANLLLPLYSLAANKLLYLAAALAASIFSLACRLRPAALAPQLSALYFAWESSLYPYLLRLLAAPALPGGGRPAAPVASVKSGRIVSDETWSGRVAVADYLTIEKGARVTVLPGAEIVFERREPWFFPVLRAGAGGELQELESAGSKLLVYGELRAAGTPAAPILFGGTAFAGIHALGGGSVSLEACRLGGSAACALSAWDSAGLLAENCAFTACARGAELYGSGRAVFRDCAFTESGGPALLARQHSSLLVYGGQAAACGGASAELSDGARGGFYGFSASGCARGFALSGRAAALLEKCGVSGNSGRAVDCAGKNSFSAAGCSFTGNPAGLRAEGENNISFSSCVFSAGAGPCAQLTGSNSAAFSGCSFAGGAGPSVQALGHNKLSFKTCSFSGGETAIDSTGCGSIEARGSGFEKTAGAALRLLRAEYFLAEGCRFSGCGAGLRAEDCARIEARGCVFEGNDGPAAFVTGLGGFFVSGSSFRHNGVGAHLSGELRARFEGCGFGAQRGAPLILSGRTTCALERSSFAGNQSGAALSGLACAEAEGCVFSGNDGPSFELSDSAELRAGGLVSSGVPAALLLEGRSAASLRRCWAESTGKPAACLAGSASLYASGSSFKSSSDAVYARELASAELEGCALFAGAGAALDLEGGAARLTAVYASGAGGLKVSGRAVLRADRLEIKAADYAADSRGSTLRLKALRSEGGSRGGILLSGGNAVIEGAVLTGAPYPGLAAGPGAALRCRGVIFEGAPWRPPALRPAPPRLRAWLTRFAAATARLPVFSGLYRLFYLAGARAAGLALNPGGGSVYLYRGMAAPGWVPGLSDMDLALLLPELPPAADWAAFASLRRRLRVFRALFPFTGEVLAAPAADFSAFVAGWGAKGAEFSAASRLLSGSLLPPVPARPARAADLTEAFYSYTLLLTHFCSEGLPRAFRSRNCLKGLADVSRYLDFEAPQRASRGAYAAAKGLRLDGLAPGDPGEAAFRSFSALHGACPAAGPGKATPAGGGGWFNRHAFEAACANLREAAGCDAGVALDALYRVYLVLPDSAAGDKAAFLRAAAVLKAAAGGGGYFSAAPLILTRSSFAALSALPYLNNPVFRLDLAAVPAGRAPEDGGVYSWNIEVPDLPPAAQVREGGVLAARHFAASWRSLWESMPPHYFYTRAAGLRLLLEKGTCPPFSMPGELSGSFSAAFGEGPSWRDFSAGGAGRANYEFVAQQARAIMEAAR